MTVRYAVTFEFETRPPVTHRGVIAASQPGTCARRAIEEAQDALKPSHWTSMNCVLLERTDRATRADDPIDDVRAADGNRLLGTDTAPVSEAGVSLPRLEEGTSC